MAGIAPMPYIELIGVPKAHGAHKREQRHVLGRAQGNRDDINNARLHSDDSPTETARAVKMECLRVIEPNAAPANIATTAAIRRCKRGLVPRARDESAARPVMVSVSAVVVRSGMHAYAPRGCRRHIRQCGRFRFNSLGVKR